MRKLTEYRTRMSCLIHAISSQAILRLISRRRSYRPDFRAELARVDYVSDSPDLRLGTWWSAYRSELQSRSMNSNRRLRGRHEPLVRHNLKSLRRHPSPRTRIRVHAHVRMLRRYRRQTLSESQDISVRVPSPLIKKKSIKSNCIPNMSRSKFDSRSLTHVSYLCSWFCNDFFNSLCPLYSMTLFRLTNTNGRA